MCQKVEDLAKPDKIETSDFKDLHNIEELGSPGVQIPNPGAACSSHAGGANELKKGKHL